MLGPRSLRPDVRHVGEVQESGGGLYYADIVVNSPIGHATTGFHYRIPPGLRVLPGQLVLVPFGPRKAQGIVLELLPTSEVEGIKDVLDVIDPQPVLSRAQIELAKWICAYYHCSLLDAVLPMLPPGVSQRSFATLEVNAEADDPANLSQKQLALVQAVRREGRIRVDKLKAQSRISGVNRTISQLVVRGVLLRRWELDKPKVKPKTERYVSLAREADDEAHVREILRSTPKQAAIVKYLRERVSSGVPLSQLYRDTGCTPQTIQALERKGLILLRQQQVWRDPLAQYRAPHAVPPVLTEEQGQVWRALESGLSTPGHAVYLIHGVTGSGKTELYMLALEHTLRAGKRAIILVPEIALTPQTVHRFSSRFPGSIAVLHSRLTLGEQYDEWRRIRDGEFKVVIGSRSAIFSPVDDLGLIVVDEEHEWSYKQEMSPRYNARDVAIRLGELTGASVILGSATPDIVTYHRAIEGKYILLGLPERVASSEEPPSGDTPAKAASAFMPPIHVVDLRQELRAGNRGIFSRALNEAISLALSLGEQVILYLNRRGTSTFVMCRDCGYVARCKRCDVPLVYHSSEDDLVCHLCARRSPSPEGCPNCWSSRIKFFGIGTQKVEEETKRLFPDARVVRWDRDTTREKGAHDRILQRFVTRQADILIGTQMIAKGLDLPRVTLVGVISADTALHLPDYRAAERTFQLLMQVAGRAGRGPLGGRVIIQTYSPEHYCIKAASRHDYWTFYQREIDFRRENAYPPFGNLIKLVYSHHNDQRCQQEAERMSALLGQHIDLEGLPATDVVGPAPAYVRRFRGRFRWQLLIRGAKCAEALRGITLPPGWLVDVDPYTTL